MFKSFDGWVAVTSDRDSTKTKILAQFTRNDDDTIVHYNAAAVRRMKDKPSSTMTTDDKKLIRQAAAEAPRYFKSFDGWHDFGRGKKTFMSASFTDSTGGLRKYNLSALQNMKASPPPKFAPADKLFLEMAIQAGPARR